MVPQHRNQYYGRNGCYVHDRYGSPNGGFRDFNCRFLAREGILSTPLKPCYVASADKMTPSPKPRKQFKAHSEGEKRLRNNGTSVAIPISLKLGNLEKSFSDDLSYAELFAGPVYSNSPPPSSLPIPKFSLRQKRSVSLELPVKEYGLKIHHVAKSAPSSPRGGSCHSREDFFRSTASDALATKDLRRILNLDIDT